MKIIHVVGARPNFMKAAPVISALSHYADVVQILVHTGQHYDVNMSDVFFRQLGMPAPDINLNIGSGSHAVQTARVMMRFEEVVLSDRPNVVIVYGDVNSTVSASLVCAKLGIPVGHVEAGLRSFDRRMPEEINRVLTDQIADLLFTPSLDGDENLVREGVSRKKIFFVGNVMIDTLVRLLKEAETLWHGQHLQFGIAENEYILVTLHRPSNVDEPIILSRIADALREISRKISVILPVHPRTRLRIKETGLNIAESSNFQLTDPLGYLDFLSLQQRARLVITDSGGIQEETTFLGVPCLTVREVTERPVTVSLGTNILVGNDMQQLKREVDRILAGEAKKGDIPPLWDGKASDRIADILVKQS